MGIHQPRAPSLITSSRVSVYSQVHMTRTFDIQAEYYYSLSKNGESYFWAVLFYWVYRSIQDPIFGQTVNLFLWRSCSFKFPLHRQAPPGQPGRWRHSATVVAPRSSLQWFLGLHKTKAKKASTTWPVLNALKLRDYSRYRKPLLTSAVYTDLTHGATHCVIFSIFLAVWTFFTVG